MEDACYTESRFNNRKDGIVKRALLSCAFPSIVRMPPYFVVEQKLEGAAGMLPDLAAYSVMARDEVGLVADLSPTLRWEHWLVQ